MADQPAMSEGLPLRDEEIARLSFEEALKRIEQIVQELEGGEVGLDEAIVRYEVGIRLIKHCRQILAKAERRVRKLVGEDEEGRPVLEEFEVEEATLTAAEEFEDPPEEPRRTNRRSRRRSAKTPPSDAGLFEDSEGDLPF